MMKPLLGGLLFLLLGIVARGSFSVAFGAAQFPADPVPTLDLPALLALLTFVGVGGMIARRLRS